jgi:hypothetical protein
VQKRWNPKSATDEDDEAAADEGAPDDAVDATGGHP